MKLDTKIQISAGCTEYLVREVETLRRNNEVLSAENKVMNNFFSLVNRLEGKSPIGYGEDRLWQAKKEIEAATVKANQDSVKPSLDAL